MNSHSKPKEIQDKSVDIAMHNTSWTGRVMYDQ